VARGKAAGRGLSGSCVEPVPPPDDNLQIPVLLLTMDRMDVACDMTQRGNWKEGGREVPSYANLSFQIELLKSRVMFTRDRIPVAFDFMVRSALEFGFGANGRWG